MLELNNVTLLAVTTVNVQATIKAMLYSMKDIKYYDAVLVTHEKPENLPEEITYKHIDKFDGIDGFNYAMVFEAYKYIESDFALLIHADGFVVNPGSWRNEFLDYDYIGSPWPLPAPDDNLSFRDPDGKIIRVGNSVSIRSRRLMELPDKIGMPWVPYYGWYNEDGYICVHNHKTFEEHGMKFAPLDVAKYFGHESMLPETEGIRPFVFHKWSGTNAEYPNFLPQSTFRDRVLGKVKRVLQHNGR